MLQTNTPMEDNESTKRKKKERAIPEEFDRLANWKELMTDTDDEEEEEEIKEQREKKYINHQYKLP